MNECVWKSIFTTQIWGLQFAHRKCIQRWCNKKGGITCEICNQVLYFAYSQYIPPNTFLWDSVFIVWLVSFIYQHYSLILMDCNLISTFKFKHQSTTMKLNSLDPIELNMIKMIGFVNMFFAPNSSCHDHLFSILLSRYIHQITQSLLQ